MLDWNRVFKGDHSSPIMNILRAAQQKQKNNSNSVNGMVRKRDKIHEPPPSANCQKTFSMFNYIPETPKNIDLNGNVQTFDINGVQNLDEFNVSKLSLDPETMTTASSSSTINENQPSELS